jgi:hypothetical protein
MQEVKKTLEDMISLDSDDNSESTMHVDPAAEKDRVVLATYEVADGGKYELKELWELTDEDREKIFEYAMKRSRQLGGTGLEE